MKTYIQDGNLCRKMNRENSFYNKPRKRNHYTHMPTDIQSLREIIRATITPTIESHRKSRRVFSIRNSSLATDEEVNRLLFSIPYFDRALCYYLMGDGIIVKNTTCLWVTENWLREFRVRVECWAGSIPWLEGELILIHFPGFMGRATVDDNQLKLPGYYLMLITMKTVRNLNNSYKHVEKIFLRKNLEAKKK